MQRKKANGLKFILPAMVLVLVFIAFKLNDQNNKISDLELQLQEKNQVLEEIKSENSQLEAEIENSDSLSFIERIARDEYGMVKPKEIIYIDKDKEDTKAYKNN